MLRAGPAQLRRGAYRTDRMCNACNAGSPGQEVEVKTCRRERMREQGCIRERAAPLSTKHAMPWRTLRARWGGCWRRLVGPVRGQRSCAGVITNIFNNKEEQDIFDKLMSVRMFDPDPYHHTCPPHAPPRGSGCVRLPARPVQRTRGWIWEMRCTHPGAGKMDGFCKRSRPSQPPSHSTGRLLSSPFALLAMVT